jgi:hypothetical protein
MHKKITSPVLSVQIQQSKSKAQSWVLSLSGMQDKQGRALVLIAIDILKKRDQWRTA